MKGKKSKYREENHPRFDHSIPVKDVCRLYSEGLSIVKLAKKFRTNYGKIMKRLELGLKRGLIKEIKGPSGFFSGRTYEEIHGRKKAKAKATTTIFGTKVNVISLTCVTA